MTVVQVTPGESASQGVRRARMLLGDALLENAEVMPADLAALWRTDGMGPTKVERDGQALLEAVAIERLSR